MVDDERLSRNPKNGYVVIEDGDSGPFGVIDIRDEETLALNMVRIQYSSEATENILVTLYDEDYDTDDVTEGDDIDAFWMEPGNEVELEDVTYDDVRRSLVVHTENDHDGNVVVSAGGMKVTG